MDDHFPQGFYYRGGHPTIYHPAPSPWGIPFSCLLARDIDNLLFAGRNISITHAALSSSRVMATCAILGQALGSAVAQAVNTHTDIAKIDIGQLQQTLLWDDCYLPYVNRKVCHSPHVHCSSEVICNGKERGDENLWTGKEGDCVAYHFDRPVNIAKVRLVFDSNLNRDYHNHNMPCNYPLKQDKYKLPETLIKDYDIEITAPDGQTGRMEFKDNRSRLVVLDLNQEAVSIKLVPKSTWGAREYRVFGFDFLSVE